MSQQLEIIVFSKLEKKTVKHMTMFIGLIALGYIIAVVGADSTPILVSGLLVMLVGWFFLIRTGHGTLHPKARSVAALRRLKEETVE